MLYSGTDLESHITEYTLVSEDYFVWQRRFFPVETGLPPPASTASLRYTSQSKHNDFAEMCSRSKERSYLRLIDCCINQF